MGTLRCVFALLGCFTTRTCLAHIFTFDQNNKTGRPETGVISVVHFFEKMHFFQNETSGSPNLLSTH